MQALTLFMIVVVTTFEFFAAGDKWGRWAFLPGWSSYLAELTGVVAAAVVVFAGARNGFRYVRPAYWLVFGFLVLIIVSGAITNRVDAGPVFAGVRTYLRAIPWFLLPAVFTFTDSQVKTQLRLLAAIAAIQLPFAVQQASTVSRPWQDYGRLDDWDADAFADIIDIPDLLHLYRGGIRRSSATEAMAVHRTVSGLLDSHDDQRNQGDFLFSSGRPIRDFHGRIKSGPTCSICSSCIHNNRRVDGDIRTDLR